MRVLVVSVEAPWPQHHGGRIRTANVSEVLATEHNVTVTYPAHEGRVEEHVEAVDIRPLTARANRALRTRLSSKPHLGGHQLRPVLGDLARMVRSVEPDLVYWSHSYLAAWGMPTTSGLLNVVEFANIEAMRLRTLASDASGPRRWARSVEAAKASCWEPAVARDASFCVALSSADKQVLERWGADVVTVPNGIRSREYRRSPENGYILAMASYDYGPNREAIRSFVRDVWPTVRSRVPQAQLIIAGRGSEDLADTFASVPGIEVRGTIDDVGDCYESAAVTLAPALTGGGSQLKVTESFSYGRCCVISRFSQKSVPEELQGTAAFAVGESAQEYADAIAGYLLAPAKRWEREKLAWQAVQPMTWRCRAEPLLRRLLSLNRSGLRAS